MIFIHLGVAVPLPWKCGWVGAVGGWVSVVSVITVLYFEWKSPFTEPRVLYFALYLASPCSPLPSPHRLPRIQYK